ncbi:DUF1015 domain-containing protein [Candidatus Sumerlaeota bacterium]|nr:DUF1015 domain-containing protein [Candidatus Sumerlaeota bacterium]
MARVLPFVGTRYNPKAVENLASVMAPPYDVISPEMQEALHERDPHNIVRLILGKELADDDEYNNKYQRAASILKEWKSSGALIDDPCKNFYIYQQEFRTPDGKTRVRTGVLAALKVDRHDKGRIHGHEHTFEGPKADRLKLLRSTRCNLSPIFCLFSDPAREIDALLKTATEKEPPRIEFTDGDKIVHRLWLLSNGAKVKNLSDLFQNKDFVIADGHHRYETAVQYCEETLRREGNKTREKCPPYTYTLAFLTDCESDDLVILPTHRVLSAELGEGVDHAEVLEDLEAFFDVEPLRVNMKKTRSEAPALVAKLEEAGRTSSAFAMVLPDGKGYLLRLKQGAAIADEMRPGIPAPIALLDVSILHEYVISGVWIGNPEIELDDTDIYYVKDACEALDMLKAPQRACAVFLMNPPRMEQVREIATQNLRMPHKTTYFYPKLITGMVLRDHTVAW